jgi:hypothetical protein
VTPLRCLFAALAWSLAVSAQGAGPTAAFAGTDSSGLERAQRLAANPMKMILEAARAPQRPALEAAARPSAEPSMARAGALRTAPPGAAPGTVAERAISVIVQLPADLDRAVPAAPLLASLAPAPAPLPPIALDSLHSLPWPAELAPGTVEPTGPRRLAGPAADAGGAGTRQVAQAEPEARP